MSNKTAHGVQIVSEPLSQEAAQQLVDVVLGNLKGRSGFDLLSNLEPEILDEMLQEMRDEMVAQVSRLVHEGQWPTTVVDKE